MMQRAPEPTDAPTAREIIGEVVDLSAGLTVMLLPLITIALPGVILLLVVPAVLLALAGAIPVALAGVLLAPPYLAVRAVRRRRRRALPATVNGRARTRRSAAA
jgi:Flp pilus assembly protein TadB